MLARLALGLLLTSCTATTTTPVAADLAITHVRVFDGARATDDQTVLVAGTRVVAVGPAAQLAVPARATRIDGHGRTLLPGLIDAHAHVNELSDAQTSLTFGVTTELDMMSIPTTTVPLAQDAPDRARVVPAGYAATAPGGHGTEYGYPVPTLTTPAQADAFVEARVAEGSHHLKIIIDDNHLGATPLPTLDAPTVAALVAAAHRHHLLAVAHVGSAADVASALAAGIDGFAHVPAEALDAATIATIAQRHLFVAPTLSVLASVCGRSPGAELVGDPRLAPYLTAPSASRLAMPFTPRPGSHRDCDAPARTVAALRAAHVVLLAGTDAPNVGTSHGASVHGELARLVAAGLTPTEALVAATSAPARAYGLADVGVIRVGAIADLVLVEGDPTRDITATRAIVGVWRGGQRDDRDAVRTAIAAARAAHDHPTAEVLGPVATFEDNAAPHARYGQLSVSTDGILGGTSSSKIMVRPDGADGTAHALDIHGTVVAGSAYPWAGAGWSPSTARTPGNLAAAHHLTFWVRGDGGTYTLLALDAVGGRGLQPFAAPTAWTRVVIDLDALHIDLAQTMIVVWAATTPGPFAFQIDQIALE